MFVQICFIGHLATLRPTLDRRQEGTLSHPMLMTTIFQVRAKGHWKPRIEVGFQSLTKRISEIQATNLLILSVTCYPTENHLVSFFSRTCRSF